VARKVTVRLEDDLDGKSAAETVRFALDGVEYEIDLSKENARKLRSKLESYIQSARRAGGAQSRRQRRAATGREAGKRSGEQATGRGSRVIAGSGIPASKVHKRSQHSARWVDTTGMRPPGPPSVPPRPPKPPKSE
jgi:hypothetical protein